jgi:tRNA(adenine34) deaminase
MTGHAVFMKAALAEAQKAFDAGETPVGAVAVYQDQILVRAHNLVETLKDASAHAEMLVLKKAAAILDRWRLKGVTLYVTVEPCPMCAMAMVLFRADRIVFGAAEPRTGAGGSFINILHNDQLNHRIDVVSGVCAEESGDLLKRFFRQIRKETEK